ncbi:MAG: enoyl-CoA hydratase-related protein [Dehalococcoidia bacterium]|nr:enoyl-CoA hydratase-related protein [Dehalococcoidia bacterium]
MEFETVLYEKKGHIAFITLNRPQMLNAISPKMSAEMYQVWRDIKADSNIRVAVLTGAGERAFCSGMDVRARTASGTPEMDTEVRFAESGGRSRITARRNDCFKPVITAVNGMVVGGGLHFLTDSDINICSENATFFDTHLELGLMITGEVLDLSRRGVPLERLMRMALLGKKERMDAQEAHRIGIVSQVVPLKELLPTATGLAEIVAEMPPLPTMLSVEAIWRGVYSGDEDAKTAAEILNRYNLRGTEATEGLMAFAQKRKPDFEKE